MKEYLNPLKGGGYELSNDAMCEGSIEVPSGAEIAIRFNCDTEDHGVIFYKNDGKASASEKNNFKWDYDSHWSNAELLDENFADGDIDLSHKVLWVRPTHPEPLPFIDDNPQSLNDQYAEIEQVRQDVINNPNQKTINAMIETEYLMQGKNGERLMESVEQLNSGKIVSAFVVDGEEKHSHYRKSVKHLDFIDPYRIAQLYYLHPCADHIAKKALCTGKRGHKDLMRDIQDIIDTAERWKQMIQEDQNAI